MCCNKEEARKSSENSGKYQTAKIVFGAHYCITTTILALLPPSCSIPSLTSSSSLLHRHLQLLRTTDDDPTAALYRNASTRLLCSARLVLRHIGVCRWIGVLPSSARDPADRSAQGLCCLSSILQPTDQRPRLHHSMHDRNHLGQP
jgi:hypothetical protein